MKQISHNATDNLAAFIETLKFSDFSSEVVAAAKASLLDFVGVAIAGFRETHLTRLLMDTIGQFDAKNDCTILGD